MNISDRAIALTIFLVSLAASVFYWIAVGDIIGSLVYFLFGSAVAGVMLLNRIKINHTEVSNFLRKMGLLPNPSEASMLVLALTTLALISVNDLWMTIFEFVQDMEDIRAPFLLVYLFLGIFLSLYHAFSARKKNQYEDAALRTYLVTTLFFLSLFTAFRMLDEKEPVYLILVLWNGLQALILIIAARSLPKEYIALPTREAKLLESVLAVLVVVIGVWIGHYVFHTYWAVIFSSIIVAWSWVQQFFGSKLNV